MLGSSFQKWGDYIKDSGVIWLQIPPKDYNLEGSLSYGSVKTWTPDSRVKCLPQFIFFRKSWTGTMWLKTQLLSLDFGHVLSWMLELEQPFRMYEDVGWEQWTCAQARPEEEWGEKGEETRKTEHLSEVYVHSWHQKKPGTDTWTSDLLLPCATRLSPVWSLNPELFPRKGPGLGIYALEKGMG